MNLEPGMNAELHMTVIVNDDGTVTVTGNATMDGATMFDTTIVVPLADFAQYATYGLEFIDGTGRLPIPFAFGGPSDATD